MKKTKEEIDEWKDYRKSLLEQKSKSDDDFEKYITYISSGALGLTVTLINNVIPIKESCYTGVIITGWILLALTLFINLFSHYLSSRYNELSLQDFDDDLDYESLILNIDKRNRLISYLNLISIISLGLGLVLILIFLAVNIS